MASGGLATAPTVDFWELDDEDAAVAHEPVFTFSKINRAAAERHAHLDALRGEFALLADELEQATSAVSSTRRAMDHPAYAAVLALGNDVIPLILERLERGRSRPVFLRLLGSLTSFQPGAGRETISDAAAEWMRWGKREGRLV